MSRDGLCRGEFDLARARQLIRDGRADEWISVRLLATVLGVSASTIYDCVDANIVPAIRFGHPQRKRVRIPCDAAHRFVYGKEEAGR